ncbi:hypothetical protein EH223_10905 [candidate division KSB1 bacterium]|nr:c-type cytochrome [candidate division KSB1 bacterium]RQW03130.1 MAG: hypothetical protein EH223_10905 [candidate division KSB1 bacterium]
MEKRLITLFQLICACSSILFIVLSCLIIMRESRPAWKNVQAEYKRIALSMSENEQQREALKHTRKRIHQLLLDDLQRIDRCMTCHAGVENPHFVEQPLPHKTHSADILQQHSVEQFGCTICHGGQGQAVDSKQAHARHEKIQWPQPLLAKEHIQSSCGQCHLTIFSNSKALEGTKIFQRGFEIFAKEGCLGCHKARGVGGSVGPDLTEQGEKTKHEYSFANIAGEHTISNWLYEHFKDPEMVSPGSDMLGLKLDDDDLHALVTFTMGMNKPDIPFEYFSIATLNEFKGVRGTLAGETIYHMACSACHGKNGEGKNYEDFETGVAAIGNQDFLAVASIDLLEFTLLNGRGRRQMAAWTPRFSGLHDQEIHNTAVFVKNRRLINSSWDQVAMTKGIAERGKMLYEQNCHVCHGDDGDAAHIISISHPDFLAVATDAFLYQTICDGRANCAMPGWGAFTSHDMADVISYVRTWQTTPGRRGVYDASNGNSTNGEQLYHYRCSRCHGTYGQGDSGPALINKDLLAAASDFYLSEMITKGRHNTAMFGWIKDVASKDKLSNEQVADIIIFLRQSAAQPKEFIYAGSNLGVAETGAKLFQQHCITCHGPNGAGTKAPALNNQELLNAGSNGYLFATIALGRKNSAMPAWGHGDETHVKLMIQERYDVVAFLRKWQTVVIKINRTL